MIRLTVIHDEEEIHDILRALSALGDSGIQVVSAYRRAPHISRLRADRPDVILMDIMGCHGIEKAREVAEQLPECGILFFSAYDHPAIVRAASSAGGHGYLCKPVSLHDLLDAIRHVAAGHRLPFPSDIGETGGQRSLSERMRRLSPRELEIVHWRAAGLSNREVGKVLGLSEKRIKNIVTRIFLKLGTSRMEETISLLHRSGVLRQGSPPFVEDPGAPDPLPRAASGGRRHPEPPE